MVSRGIRTRRSEGRIWVPKVSLKRYWDTDLWSDFYVELLNSKSAAYQLDINALITSFEEKVKNTPESVSKVSCHYLITSDFHFP